MLVPAHGAESAVRPAVADTIAAIQVQGNTATPDADVLRLADVRVGMPFDDAMVDAVATRLRAAKRFESVEVRKRFASIADPSQITLVIVVDEGPVKIVMTGDPDNPTRVVRKKMPNLLILPILSQEDGYGVTYDRGYYDRGYYGGRGYDRHDRHDRHWDHDRRDYDRDRGDHDRRW